MRNYRDFIIYTDYYEGVSRDAKDRPGKCSLRVFDSPMGEGEHDDPVVITDWDQLDRWRNELASKDMRPDHFEAFARRLGELILPSYARQLYQGSLGLIWNNVDDRLRVRLRLIPELAYLPWEYALVQLHEGEITDEDYWALNFRVSVVRHEMIAVPAAPFGTSPSRRVIFAMASPKPYELYPPLDLAGEQRAIKSELKLLHGVVPEYYPDFDSTQPEAGATEDTIRRELQNPADIFHFSGHGVFRSESANPPGRSGGHGAILLARENNQAEEIDAGALSSLLAEGHIRLVVLDACESGERDMFLRWSSVATALMKKGIPAVVAMQFSVYDDLAKEFARKIYEYLVPGLTIDEAVTQGRIAMRRKDAEASDWGSPVLYLRNSGGNIFPPVTDENACALALKTAEQDTTLSEVVMRWTQDGAPASKEQLLYLEQAHSALHLKPLDALLLLRSAVMQDQEAGTWVEELRKVGAQWLSQIQAPPIPAQKTELPRKLLGVDNTSLPAAAGKVSRLAWSAVLSSNLFTGQTAALALLALAPGEVISQIREALPAIDDGRRRRRRRAALIGTLAEADPEVAKTIPRAFDNAPDRTAIWWWRARKHIRYSSPAIARWTIGGALGGGLALAVYRAVLALFNSLPVGTEFAINSYWGFLSTLGLVLGIVVAGPLLLQDPSRPAPSRRGQVAALAVFLGALGFCAASALVVFFNGISLGMTAGIFMRYLATSLLVGLGLGLGLYDQPRAGWSLGVGGWVKRLGIAAVFLALIQLPVLCEGLTRSGGGYWLSNAQWLAAPIIQPSEAITNQYSLYPCLQSLFESCHPGEVGRCCFACQAAGGSAVSNLFSDCFEQWLSVLDAALVGIVLCLGITVGIDFPHTGLGRRLAELKARWQS
jgi:hypothetical protein